MTITEKLDGTNSQIHIGENGEFLVGSRNRWVTPKEDNHGFATWAHEHKTELLTLGPGTHFGEWWGLGIQRGYGLKEKRFSLFNTARWCLHGETPKQRGNLDPTAEVKMQDVLPACCGLVPVLYQGMFETSAIQEALEELRFNGSAASLGFKNPEGIIVYHHAMNACFKVTLERDEVPKSKVTK